MHLSFAGKKNLRATTQGAASREMRGTTDRKDDDLAAAAAAVATWSDNLRTYLIDDDDDKHCKHQNMCNEGPLLMPF